MMKLNRIVLVTFTVLTGFVACHVSAGQMLLRDAIYLYSQDIRSYRYLEIAGYQCDALVLALDMDSGYADLTMWEGESNLKYPDRIRDYHEMYVYALYKPAVSYKGFQLADHTVSEPAQDVTVGRGTVFGYCYSTNPNAYVFRYESLTGICARASGPITCPASGKWRY